MRNEHYWNNRMRILEESLLDTGYEYINNLEKQYDIAIRDIEGQIATWYQRFAKDNAVSLAEAKRLLSGNELKEFRWTVEEYIKHGEQNAISQAWLKQLKNASAKVHISRLDSLKIQLQQQAELLYGNQLDGIDKLASKIYSKGYYHTAFEVQKGIGVGWSMHGLTDTAIRKVLSRPWTLDGQTFSDRIWNNKQGLVNTVNTQLTQMLMRGTAPDKAIKTISERFRVSKSQAGKLVMTESAAFSNIARKDCFTDLGVEEFSVVETLDNETCSLCGELDGKVFPMSEYVIGVTAPPFHPWCRGTTAPHFADLDGLIERAARGADGKTYYVPGNMKYGEWKKRFVKDEAYTEPQKGDIINNKIAFTQASTIKEAEDFARSKLGIQNVSYKGCDITTANAWNEGLTDSFNRFPELKKNFGFVGEAHERNNMIKPRARQIFLEQLMADNPGYSAEDLMPYAEANTKRLMRQLSVGRRTIAQSLDSPNRLVCDFRGVSVNKEFGKNSQEFIDFVTNDVRSKFHPVGCTSIRSVLDHEIGHQLDSLLGIGSIDKIQALYNSRTPEEITNGLSKYAWKNDNKDKYSEMIAESWSEYCNNPQPREMAKIVGKTIESEYKKKFGR